MALKLLLLLAGLSMILMGLSGAIPERPQGLTILAPLGLVMVLLGILLIVVPGFFSDLP